MQSKFISLRKNFEKMSLMESSFGVWLDSKVSACCKTETSMMREIYVRGKGPVVNVKTFDTK